MTADSEQFEEQRQQSHVCMHVQRDILQQQECMIFWAAKNSTSSTLHHCLFLWVPVTRTQP
jgi:hypothetical protein